MAGSTASFDAALRDTGINTYRNAAITSSAANAAVSTVHIQVGLDRTISILRRGAHQKMECISAITNAPTRNISPSSAMSGMKPETPTPPELSKEIQTRLGEKLRTTYEHIRSHLPARIIILSRKLTGSQQEIPNNEIHETHGEQGGDVLDPETTVILQAALDEGWAAVHRTGSTHISREDLAKRLIALLWTGERSSSKLVIQAFRTLHRKLPAKDSEGES
jgi:hypothetical protein